MNKVNVAIINLKLKESQQVSDTAGSSVVMLPRSEADIAQELEDALYDEMPMVGRFLQFIVLQQNSETLKGIALFENAGDD